MQSKTAFRICKEIYFLSTNKNTITFDCCTNHSRCRIFNSFTKIVNNNYWYFNLFCLKKSIHILFQKSNTFFNYIYVYIIKPFSYILIIILITLTFYTGLNKLLYVSINIWPPYLQLFKHFWLKWLNYIYIIIM